MRVQRKCSNPSSPLHAEVECLIWVMEELSSRQQVNFESTTSATHTALRAMASIWSWNRRHWFRKEARSRDLNYLLVDIMVSEPLALEASMLKNWISLILKWSFWWQKKLAKLMIFCKIKKTAFFLIGVFFSDSMVVYVFKLSVLIQKLSYSMDIKSVIPH